MKSRHGNRYWGDTNKRFITCAWKSESYDNSFFWDVIKLKKCVHTSYVSKMNCFYNLFAISCGIGIACSIFGCDIYYPMCCTDNTIPSEKVIQQRELIQSRVSICCEYDTSTNGFRQCTQWTNKDQWNLRIQFDTCYYVDAAKFDNQNDAIRYGDMNYPVDTKMKLRVGEKLCRPFTKNDTDLAIAGIFFLCMIPVSCVLCTCYCIFEGEEEDKKVVPTPKLNSSAVAPHIYMDEVARRRQLQITHVESIYH